MQTAGRTLRVGLTGGIGSGKSTVGRMFSELGVPRLDADSVARAVVAAGEPGLARIAAVFGSQLLLADGSLDRAALRQLIFAQPASRARLEAITHPLIARRTLDWLAQQQGPYLILESPLLLETRQHEWVDRILVVEVPESQQIARTVARDHTTAEQTRAIIAAQMPADERRQRADDVLCNDGDLEALKHSVLSLHQRYLALSGAAA